MASILAQAWARSPSVDASHRRPTPAVIIHKSALPLRYLLPHGVATATGVSKPLFLRYKIRRAPEPRREKGHISKPLGHSVTNFLTGLSTGRSAGNSRRVIRMRRSMKTTRNGAILGRS